MQKQAIAEFTLEDGTKVYFEVPAPRPGKALQSVGVDVGATVYAATGAFEQALDKIQPVVNAVIAKIGRGLTTPADEVEVKFGVNLTADAGVIFSSVGGEVNFEITVKWQKQAPTNSTN